MRFSAAGIMHETELLEDNRCKEKRNVRPKRNICPDCQSIGRSSKLEWSFLGLSSGIWMCSHVKCNFPLNSEDLQVYIETFDPHRSKESRLRKKPSKRKKQCTKCRDKTGLCNIHCISSTEDMSFMLPKAYTKTGKANMRSSIPKGTTSFCKQNTQPNYKKKKMVKRFYKQVDEKSNELGNVSLFLERACPMMTSLDICSTNDSLQTSVKPIPKNDMGCGETKVDIDKFELLRQYAPFISKGVNESDESFVIAESQVLPIDAGSMTAVKKENGIVLDECYDSAYSSPASDELNMQLDFSPSVNHHSPVFESAMEMIDSIFDEENRKEHVSNPVSFLNETFNILGNDIDISKLC